MSFNWQFHHPSSLAQPGSLWSSVFLEIKIIIMLPSSKCTCFTWVKSGSIQWHGCSSLQTQNIHLRIFLFYFIVLFYFILYLNLCILRLTYWIVTTVHLEVQVDRNNLLTKLDRFFLRMHVTAPQGHYSTLSPCLCLTAIPETMHCNITWNNTTQIYF